jgi:hypothetical protein
MLFTRLLVGENSTLCEDTMDKGTVLKTLSKLKA